MWGSQENLGPKVNEKIFRVDPGEKNKKREEKNIIFRTPLF